MNFNCCFFVLFSGLIISCNQDNTSNKIDSTFPKDSIKKPHTNFDSIFENVIGFKQDYTWNDFNLSEKIPKNSVCINYKKFAGQSPFDIPFVGQAGENIDAIIINGKKKIKIEGREVFFRAKIPLEFGYNRVPIKVINKNKEESEFYIEISVTQY
jgi:hypothetical protein